jgi:hypothetical protein
MERKQRVFQYKELRKIFGCIKDDAPLGAIWFILPTNTISATNSRRKKSAVHVARIEETIGSVVETWQNDTTWNKWAYMGE